MNNHKEYITDLINSGYKNTANWILSDLDLIEAEYLDGSEAECPGTYVWVSNDSEVLYIGEYGYYVKYRMNQHWSSWSKTTRSNQKMDESKLQKGDIIMEHLSEGKSVKIYSKPASVVHIESPHPLVNFRTDVPNMLRLDTKSDDEAHLIEAFQSLYTVKPQLNGTKGSKGYIVSEGYNYPASSTTVDVKLAAPETNSTIETVYVDEYPDRARPDGFEFNKIQDNLRGMYIPEYNKDEQK